MENLLIRLKVMSIPPAGTDLRLNLKHIHNKKPKLQLQFMKLEFIVLMGMIYYLSANFPVHLKNPRRNKRMLELSAEELAEYSGKDGKPVYVAHGGKIYDLSGSKMWRTGVHMRRHNSGADLTADIAGAPHGPEVLEHFPQVGILKLPEKAEKGLLDRYPILRRHPHPMTVHFPIALMLSATFFTLLFLVTGHTPFETTSFHCLAAGTLFTPIVVATGLISWQINYMGRKMTPITIKLITSITMLLVQVILFSWRLAVPDIITGPGRAAAIYLLLMISLSPMVVVIGWYGANLTFPVEKD